MVIPGGPEAGSLPVSAADAGFILVQEDPAACGATKPVSTTTGAWVPEFTHCSREQPLFSPTRESLCTATEIQRSRKYISLKKKKEN